MKVAVITPSYNEADNISYVTQTIDRGLGLAKKKFPSLDEVIIVNIDNSSPDKTSDFFKKTSTSFPKLSILTKGRAGKGKSLLYFLKKYNQDYDVFVSLDADLKSIKADWIVKLLEPFFNKRGSYDFVWPLYKRSRFEGSTTNHFAYPVMYAVFGKEIRQPIAGDFAFNKKIAVKIIENKIPAEAYRYGVDILFSIRAAQYGRRVVQINLGHKIHKPSFPKLEKMFPQVAAAALDTLRYGGAVRRSSLHVVDTKKEICTSSSRRFEHRAQGDLLLEKKVKYLSDNLDKIVWLSPQFKYKIRRILNGDKIISSQSWSNILAGWLRYSLRSGRHSLRLSEELLPFFVLRAVSFWHEAERLKANEVEKRLKAQARLVRRKFN